MTDVNHILWRDEILAKLREVSEFYGKKLNQAQIDVWLRTLRGRDPKKVSAAFDSHYAHGRYMPRPAEIIEHIGVECIHSPDTLGEYTPPPGHISQAYEVYLNTAYNFEMPGRKQHENKMPFEQALVTVNRHMFMCNVHEYIEEHLQLPDEWGKAA